MVLDLSTDVITRVYEKVANSVGYVYGPCIRVHDRVQAVLTAKYTACTRPSTRSCTWLCTRAVSMTMYGPCTRVNHVYTSMDTARAHRPCTRPCTWLSTRPSTRPYTRLCTRAVSIALYGLCTRVHHPVHGSVRATYKAVYGPCTQPLQGRV